MGGGQSLLSSVLQLNDSFEEEPEHYSDPAEPARLVRVLLSRLGLPAELVLDIMDLADYHPRVSAAHDEPAVLAANRYRHDDHCSALLYLATPPISYPREGESWRVLRVTWMIEGCDQGWGGQRPGERRSACILIRSIRDIHGNAVSHALVGTFDGAHSWYETSILRPSGPFAAPEDLRDFLVNHALCRTPDDIDESLKQLSWQLVPNPSGGHTWRVQSNRVARREFTQYTIEWLPGCALDAEMVNANGHGDGAGFVDALRPGDVVVLWARAMYPGWKNTVKAASVDIVYDVR